MTVEEFNKAVDAAVEAFELAGKAIKKFAEAWEKLSHK